MLAISVPPPPPPPAAAEVFSLGTVARPGGPILGVDSVSLLRDARRWMPVMGEFHYARVPAADWREELLKLKAGGIDLVASYVFWIHHEEIEGERDWSDDRDLRRFVETARDAGLEVVVRLGPWCHGEVRNGGLPDWLVATFGDRARTDDPAYLAAVRRHFADIAARLDGLLWKQGGPVVGFQIENEFYGPADHLLTLKRIAREVGLDAPLYTRTGWPELATPIPFGELLPLYGAYPEGFWDREITPMPNAYPANFRFTPLRTDAGIATDLLGKRDAADTPGTERYPFLTCELGGGMMSSYHRRLRIDPRDIASLTLTKLGSGGNLPGYYMYHGGVNPEGRLGSLHESQATRYWNDLPEKNYDFQAPVGAAGQLRPHYHLLRRLHLLVRDFGERLAAWPATFPAERPAGRDDLSTLRWSVRAGAEGGFVFINNYERLRSMPEKAGLRFSATLPDGARAEFPSSPVTVPADSFILWPFRLQLAPGVRLDHATAQLVCQLDVDEVRTIFFAATPGVPAEFAFNGEPPVTLAPGRTIAHRIGPVRIVLLDEADSLALYKADWRGRERVFLTRAGLVVDGDTLRLSAHAPETSSLSVFPSIEKSAELFAPLPLRNVSGGEPIRLVASPVHAAGPAREIPFGWTTPAVAVAPTDADFQAAAVWRVELPDKIDFSSRPLLRIAYVGDVARVRVGERLVLDDFYNGDALELDLARHADALARGASLTLEVLPLRPDAPILLPEGTRPTTATARVDSVTLAPRFTATVP